MPTEGLEMIVESSTRYTCLRDSGDFEYETIWKTKKKDGKCFRGRYNIYSEGVYNYCVGNTHVHNWV